MQPREGQDAASLPAELRPPCPRGCVDVEGCGCEWNQRREAWPNEPLAAPLRRYAEYAARHSIKFNDGRGNEIEVGPAILALLDHRDNLDALLREWFDLGDLPSGGYGGTLRYRTEAELGRLAS